MSYGTKVYRKAGGDELVVAPGGKLTIESGGTLDGGRADVDDRGTEKRSRWRAAVR